MQVLRGEPCRQSSCPPSTRLIAATRPKPGPRIDRSNLGPEWCEGATNVRAAAKPPSRCSRVTCNVPSRPGLRRHASLVTRIKQTMSPRVPPSVHPPGLHVVGAPVSPSVPPAMPKPELCCGRFQPQRLHRLVKQAQLQRRRQVTGSIAHWGRNPLFLYARVGATMSG